MLYRKQWSPLGFSLYRADPDSEPTCARRSNLFRITRRTAQPFASGANFLKIFSIDFLSCSSFFSGLSGIVSEPAPRQIAGFVRASNRSINQRPHSVGFHLGSRGAAPISKPSRKSVIEGFQRLLFLCRNGYLARTFCRKLPDVR